VAEAEAEVEKRVAEASLRLSMSGFSAFNRRDMKGWLGLGSSLGRVDTIATGQRRMRIVLANDDAIVVSGVSCSTCYQYVG
jgi:hypothetical protein